MTFEEWVSQRLKNGEPEPMCPFLGPHRIMYCDKAFSDTCFNCEEARGEFDHVESKSPPRTSTILTEDGCAVPAKESIHIADGNLTVSIAKRSNGGITIYSANGKETSWATLTQNEARAFGNMLCSVIGHNKFQAALEELEETMQANEIDDTSFWDGLNCAYKIVKSAEAGGEAPETVKLTLKEFRGKYCAMCGSQRCEGPGSEWFSGCEYADELIAIKTPEEIIKEIGYGDCYTTTEFAEYVRRGSFISYDGVGYYHDGYKETMIPVSFNPEEIIENGKVYPYVCWYNK